MDPTFGARLRQQREERQVTLTTISTKTKIKLALLEALESDDFSAWPKGLFGRAYLRDYATAIGLDPESVVSEFLALHPEFSYVTPQVEEAEAAARADAARSGAAQKLRRFVSSALSVMPIRNQVPTTADHSATGRPRYHDDSTRSEAEVFSATVMPVLAEAEERLSPQEALDTVELEEHVPFMELEAEADPPADEHSYAAPHHVTHAVRSSSRAYAGSDISLPAIADVCTRLARALDWREVTTLLADAARLFDAVGVIVWQWDAHATALRPSLACGYSENVVARLPEVRSDDANAVATAFRSGTQCVVDGADGEAEAVVVPSLGVGGCVGVLAVELRPGTRQRESICAFANILAAQLAMLLPSPAPVEA